MRDQPQLDPSILAIASLTDLPRQPVNLKPRVAFLGAQIQQIRASAQAPVVSASAPITITRRSLGNGQFQFRVQFIRPTRAQDPNYQGTSVLLASAGGTTKLAAASGEGPIVFTADKSSAPTSAMLQQQNVNATSDTGLGNGNSKALVQL